MKAPEKIYLSENPITEEPDYMWLSNRSCNEDIEYIRVDTSVDKAANEKLRKTTIAFLKEFAEQGYENAVECINWLEKQQP